MSKPYWRNLPNRSWYELTKTNFVIGLENGEWVIEEAGVYLCSVRTKLAAKSIVYRLLESNKKDKTA